MGGASGPTPTQPWELITPQPETHTHTLSLSLKQRSVGGSEVPADCCLYLQTQGWPPVTWFMVKEERRPPETGQPGSWGGSDCGLWPQRRRRSEEHTSELQSR